MRPFAAAALVVLGSAPAAGPALAAPGRAAQTMTCHMLIGGVPSKDPVVFTLKGRDLFSTAWGKTRLISTEGRILALGSTTDKGVVTLTSAAHRRAGNVVTRWVYWKTGARPRYVAMTERYDFARQTLIGSDGIDACHHNGR